MKLRLFTGLTASLGVLLAAPSVLAQESVLEEVVVTAQKRQQDIQDVGIAVSAWTGPMMEQLGVEQSFDIASFTPGVHISGNLAGQNTQFTIRGVTQNDFNDIIEAPNAMYLDEGYIAIANAQTFAVFDIDRVEILKGPQGTLFGRNATGGLVHYISRQPTFDGLDGYLDLTYGRFSGPADANQFTVEGAIGGPISDNFAARASFRYNYHDPYLKNNYTDEKFPDPFFGGPPGPGAGADLADDDTIAGRLHLLFEPNSRLSVRVSVNATHSDLSTGPYQSKPTIAVFDAVDGGPELVNVIDVGPNETRASIATPELVDLLGLPSDDFGTDLDNNGLFAGDGDPADFFGRFGVGTDFFGYVDPDGFDFSFDGDFAFNNSAFTEAYGVNGRIEYALRDNIQLTSVTDWKQYKKLLFIDVDSAPVNQLANYAGVDATSLTQEIRLNGTTARANWTAGFFFLNIDTDSDNGLKAPVNGLVPGAPIDIGVDAQLETNSYSLFGQFEYDLTDQFRIVLGGRFIQEEKDYVFAQNLYFGNTDSTTIHQGDPLTIGPIFPGGVPAAFTDSTSDSLWAGKVQAEYRPNENLLLYAGVNRGVKAGSFNAQLAGGLPLPDPGAVIPYGEEILWSYEGGFKYTFPDGATRINGTVFYYDYQDYQAFLFTGVSGIVVNADAENVGAEFEIQSTPIPGLDLRAGVAWFDATVKDVPFRIGGPIVRDVDPTYAPEFQFSALARYSWPMFGGRMSIMGDFSYSDEYFYNLRNFDADKFDDYYVLNARIGWQSNDGRWDASVKIRNLTDERVGIQGFDLATLCGCNEISFQPPRWYGFSLRYQL